MLETYTQRADREHLANTGRRLSIADLSNFVRFAEEAERYGVSAAHSARCGRATAARQEAEDAAHFARRALRAITTD